jgi:predicted CoA-binding protein
VKWSEAVNEHEKIETFLAGRRFAVVGASQDRAKYGNKVLRVYLQNDRDVVPINPSATEIEGLTAYRDLASVPGEIDGVSIITPPAATERVVQDAVRCGIKNIWMQPGAESERAIQAAEESGANVIAGGPCILVSLRFREHD